MLRNGRTSSGNTVRGGTEGKEARSRKAYSDVCWKISSIFYCPVFGITHSSLWDEHATIRYHEARWLNVFALFLGYFAEDRESYSVAKSAYPLRSDSR
jgi:hypothetical protein